MANIVYMARSAWTNLLDTIRSKASVSGTMTVSQAQNAVNSITGGDDSFDKLVEKSIVNASGKASKIGSYAFAYCGSLSTADFSQATDIGASAFFSCANLTTISFPQATTMGSNAFLNCIRLSAADFPEVTYIGNSAFAYCSSLSAISFPLARMGNSVFAFCKELKAANLPKATQIGPSAFAYCYKLSTCSFPGISLISTLAFTGCYNLLSLYLLGSSFVTLGMAGAFNSTPISGYTASTGGVYGSIFVPASLYNSYLTATNWSLYSSRIVSVTE